MTPTTEPPVRPALPNPPLRLALGTARLAVVAHVCTLLAWSLPLAPGGVVPHREAPLSVVIASVLLVPLAVALRVYMSRSAPNPLRVLLLLVTSGVACYAALHSFTALDPADHRYQSGPAGWVCAALFAGTAALALFAGAAMYENWRDAHGRSPEHAVARRRIEAALQRRSVSLED